MTDDLHPDHAAEDLTPDDWRSARRALGIPCGWTLRPHRQSDGSWKLTATGGTPLRCGHRSMEVTADKLPLAVARMAGRLRFHLTEKP